MKCRITVLHHQSSMLPRVLHAAHQACEAQYNVNKLSCVVCNTIFVFYLVDGAIHRGAGSSLKMECATLNGCDTGDVKLTGGHKLPAKRMSHGTQTIQ